MGCRQDQLKVKAVLASLGEVDRKGRLVPELVLKHAAEKELLGQVRMQAAF